MMRMIRTVEEIRKGETRGTESILKRKKRIWILIQPPTRILDQERKKG